MQEWAFRPLKISDLPWLKRCRDTSAHPFTALSPVSLTAWADTYGLDVAGDEDFFVIRSRHDKGYYAPVGDPEKCAAFMEKAGEKERPARFVYVEENEARRLAEKGWHMLFRGDLSEYILSSASMALVPGTFTTESFRGKCHRFARDFGGFRAEPVTGDNLYRLREISEKYLATQERAPADQAVVDLEMEQFSLLGMEGLLLTMPDGRGAFILGYENTPGMFTMTMARHDPTLPAEMTDVCIHEFASVLCDRYPLLNVEEDMGMDGLRRAKQLLSPVDLLKVYEVLG